MEMDEYYGPTQWVMDNPVVLLIVAAAIPTFYMIGSYLMRVQEVLYKGKYRKLFRTKSGRGYIMFKGKRKYITDFQIQYYHDIGVE